MKSTSKENVNQKPKYYIYFIRIGEPEKRLFKIGTTNDMDRRMKEHKRYYKQDVEVLGTIEVTSEFTTLRVEKLTKQDWRENHPDWQYLRNDRFIIPEDVTEIEIKVRKFISLRLRDTTHRNRKDIIIWKLEKVKKH